METPTGSAQLRANFTPEIINLRWYNNNTLLNATSASNTCTYDTAINLPTNPTKPGYKFKGWKVRPEYDFSTLYQNTPTYSAYGKGRRIVGGIEYLYCLYIDPTLSAWQSSDCTNGDFNDLALYEWKAPLDSGMLYGYSLCSSTPSDEQYAVGTPDESTYGYYCWCKSTGFIPNNENTLYAPNKNMKWVYVENANSNCMSRCAFLCSAHQRSSNTFRIHMLGMDVQ